MLIVGLFFWTHVDVVLADPYEDAAWQELETAHTVIRYQDPKDLTKLNARIRFPGKNWGIIRLFKPGDIKDLRSMVVRKVDIIFERAQQILGMRKPMKKVSIRVYQNRAQLHQAYKTIYGGRCRIRAWYRYRNNSVYVNVRDLNEGMLAHELAHAIIDNYLDVRPPRATAEILARYVDSHLKR
ncbi:MAG: hypothetical protein JRI36_10595 [Deltaproteobacteria bacterium]|nr:hypothetical protein [Deltaproteobacteria bacterium]